MPSLVLRSDPPEQECLQAISGREEDTRIVQETGNCPPCHHLSFDVPGTQVLGGALSLFFLCHFVNGCVQNTNYSEELLLMGNFSV